MTDRQLEKASVEYADKTAKQYEVCNSEFVQEIMVAFEQGAQDALASQWIPVDERLPEDDALVLAHFSNVDRELCYATAYYIDGTWQTPDDWYYDCRIDFWMPIPAIPPLKPEKEER